MRVESHTRLLSNHTTLTVILKALVFLCTGFHLFFLLLPELLVSKFEVVNSPFSAVVKNVLMYKPPSR